MKTCCIDNSGSDLSQAKRNKYFITIANCAGIDANDNDTESYNVVLVLLAHHTYSHVLGIYPVHLPIEVLNISLNNIKAGGGEPTGTQVFLAALKHNVKLKELVMDKDLARALHLNTSIIRLELAGLAGMPSLI